MIIGVLSLQGDYFAHGEVLQRLGRRFIYVRNPAQLKQVDALIIPGGESTTIRKMAKENGLWELMRRFDGPMLGTCAGIIILASTIENPIEEGLGKLNINISRNAYGSQINSFATTGKILPDGKEMEMVFIRAPQIVKLGPDVEVVAEHKGQPVGVIQNKIMGLTFHPELSGNPALYEQFFSLGDIRSYRHHNQAGVP